MTNSVFQKAGLSLRTLPVLALLALFIILYLPTWSGLFAQWMVMDETLSHGSLVFALFCVWWVTGLQDKNRITHSPLTFAFPFLALFLNSIGWAVFQLVDIEILAILELPVLVVLMLWGFYGFRQTFALLPVLALLVFVLPVWDYLTPSLVDLSGFIVGHIVGMMGMPALIEGNSIILPHGIILIADGCSGQRYLVISIALTYIAAIMNRLSIKKSIIYLTLAVLLGLFTNWVRIFALVIIGYVTDMQSGLLADHEFFGWVLFACIVVPFLYFIPVYSKQVTKTKHAFEPFVQKQNVLQTALLVIALVSGPLLVLSSNNFTPAFIADSVRTVPAFEPVVAIPASSPLTLPSRALDLNIQRSAADLYLVQAGWGKTENQQKIVPYFSRLYDHSYWLVETSTQNQLPDGTVYRTLQLRRKGGSQTWLVGYWYEVGSFTANSYSKAKILQIPAILTGQNRFYINSAVIECDRLNCDSQYQILESSFNQLMQSKRKK